MRRLLIGALCGCLAIAGAVLLAQGGSPVVESLPPRCPRHLPASNSRLWWAIRSSVGDSSRAPSASARRVHETGKAKLISHPNTKPPAELVASSGGP